MGRPAVPVGGWLGVSAARWSFAVAFDEPSKTCGFLTEVDYAAWTFAPGDDHVTLSDLWQGGRRRDVALTLPLAEIDEFITREDRGRIGAALRAACAPGASGEVCLRYRTDEPGGRNRVIDVRGSGVRAEDGRLARLRGVRVDVTALVEAQARAARFGALVDRARDLFAVSDGDGRLLQLNEGGCGLVGIAPDAWEGLRLQDLLTREAARYLETQVRPTVLREGRAEGTLELRHQTSGEAIPCAHECYLITDPDGGAPVFAAIIRDLRAERAAERLLHAHQERAAMALRCGGMGVGEIDLATLDCVVDERFSAILGLEHCPAPPAQRLLGALAPTDRDRLAERLAAIRAGAPPQIFSGRCRPGGAAHVEMDVEVIERDETGRPLRLIGLLRDVSDAVETADRLQARADALAAERDRATLLVDELNHRVRNNLSMMQAIVNMSARSDVTDEDCTGILERISALAIAHTISEGGTRPVRLRDVLQAVAAPRTDAVIDVRGAPVVLAADSVTPIVLLFNELAANAVQHGALAATGGTVAARWDVLQDGLRVEWTEAAPAATLTPPERTGVGTQLIAAAAGQIGATVARVWRPEGLRVALTIPEHAVARADVPAAP